MFFHYFIFLPATSTSTTTASPDPLTFRDVLLLTGSWLFLDEGTTLFGSVRPASGFIRGLRRGGVPVRVVSKMDDGDDSNNIAEVALMTGPDAAVAADHGVVPSLERKVVVVLEFDNTVDRFDLASRSTAQLVLVQTPASHSVMGWGRAASRGYGRLMNLLIRFTGFSWWLVPAMFLLVFCLALVDKLVELSLSVLTLVASCVPVALRFLLWPFFRSSWWPFQVWAMCLLSGYRNNVFSLGGMLELMAWPPLFWVLTGRRDFLPHFLILSAILLFCLFL